MIEEIIRLHAEMRELTLKAGVKESKYDLAIKNIETMKDEKLVKLYAHIINVYNNEYKEAYRIRHLPHINEAMWDMYKAMLLRDFPEQLLLRKAFKNLRHSWAQFCRGYNVGSRKRRDKKHTEEKEGKAPEVQPDVQTTEGCT